MSNKAINKDYLLTQLKNLDKDILSKEYGIIEITQADYDNLTPGQKKDKTFLITDGDGFSNIKDITQEEYENLSDAEKMNGTLYCIKDGTPQSVTSALNVYYDNGISGLKASNTQDAITELAGKHKLLWQGYVTQGSIVVDTSDYNILAFVMNFGRVCFTKITNRTFSETLAAGSSPLNTGTTFIMGQAVARIDIYPDHIYVHEVYDLDTQGNKYLEGRSITEIWAIC